MKEDFTEVIDGSSDDDGGVADDVVYNFDDTDDDDDDDAIAVGRDDGSKVGNVDDGLVDNKATVGDTNEIYVGSCDGIDCTNCITNMIDNNIMIFILLDSDLLLHSNLELFYTVFIWT
jgi:hypothetical protein